MGNNTSKNIVAMIATVFILAILWYAFDAFFSLVGALYVLLDGYIWAFFAGIIAFFTAIALVGIMIRITFLLIILAVPILMSIFMGIVILFGGRTR